MIFNLYILVNLEEMSEVKSDNRNVFGKLTLLYNDNTNIRPKSNIYGDLGHFMKMWPLT